MPKHALNWILAAAVLTAGAWFLWFQSSSQSNFADDSYSEIGEHLVNSSLVQPRADKRIEPYEVISETVEKRDLNPTLSGSEVNIFFEEPEQGTPSYLDARDQAEYLLPYKVFRILRHRVVATRYSSVQGLIGHSQADKEFLKHEYQIPFFKDMPCTAQLSKYSDTASSAEVFIGYCREIYGSRLKIRLWPNKSKFSITLSARGVSIKAVQVNENYMVIYELDPNSGPKSVESY